MSARRRLAVALVLAGLVGCEGPPTQILVVVDAQPMVRSRATAIQVRMWGRGRDQDDFGMGTVFERTDQATDYPWPRRFAIAPEDRDPSRLWRFEALGVDDTGSAFVVSRIVSGYTRGESLQVVLVLFDNCIDMLCQADLNSTCDPTIPACVDARRDNLDPLSPCESDADCDDGFACTVDQCVGTVCAHVPDDSLCADLGCAEGRCIEGEPTAGRTWICARELVDSNCDDGLDCTSDACRADGVCVPIPDDDLCTLDTGGRCDAMEGCQYDACTPANCDATATGCQSATCSGGLCDRTPLCGSGQMCCHDACVAAGCDDGSECTTDRCDPAAGCVNDPSASQGDLCDDADPCTMTTTCSAGICTGGSDCAVQAGPCRVGTCTATGCTFSNRDGASCPGGTPSCPNVCSGGVCGLRACSDGGGFDAGTGGMDAGRDAGTDGGIPPGMDAGRDASTGLDAGGGAMDGGTCGGTTCPMPGDACCGGTCCETSLGSFCCGTMCCPAGFACVGGTTCTPISGLEGGAMLDDGGGV
ncbi:MAG: hypothetical protein AB7S26_35395 [Sandaracinaceae bacterium]